VPHEVEESEGGREGGRWKDDGCQQKTDEEAEGVKRTFDPFAR
jgi:hypothetical protein